MSAREEYEGDKDILYQLDQYAVVKRADAALAEADERIKELESTQQLCIVYKDQMYFEEEVVEKLAQADAALAALTAENEELRRERDAALKREKVAAMFGDAFEDAAKGSHWMLEYERGLNHVLVANWQFASRADEAEASVTTWQNAYELADAEVKAMKAERIDTGIGLSEQLLKATERAMQSEQRAKWWKEYANETEDVARWAIDREREDLAGAEQRVRELEWMLARVHAGHHWEPEGLGDHPGNWYYLTSDDAFELHRLTTPEPKEN